jgi:hypothetical protein
MVRRWVPKPVLLWLSPAGADVTWVRRSHYSCVSAVNRLLFPQPLVKRLKCVQNVARSAWEVPLLPIRHSQHKTPHTINVPMRGRTSRGCGRYWKVTMGIRRKCRLLAMIAVTGGITGATSLPALAAPAVTPTVSINVSSGIRVSGLTLVFFRSRVASATVSGSVTSAASSEVVRLYSRQFPFKKPFARVGAPVTLTGSGTVSYSFPKVTPTLATRYKVELFVNGAATTPLASSAVKVVYVSKSARVTETHKCPPPNCISTGHFRIFVPAQAMRAERAKRLFTYFAVNLSPTHTPPPPRLLRLGAGHPHVSRIRKIAANEYAFTVTFTFRVDHDVAVWIFAACTKDTVATDGLGLPGHHSCGARTISARIRYLG